MFILDAPVLVIHYPISKLQQIFLRPNLGAMLLTSKGWGTLHFNQRYTLGTNSKKAAVGN